MRPVTIVAVALGALVLGTVQLVSMAFYGDLAQSPAVPAFVAPSIGFALGRPLAAMQAPVFARVAYARALLHRGATPAAAAIVMGLPDSTDAADLRGQIAELQGQPDRALAAYARAGDFERAQRLIDLRVAARQYAQAALLEGILVDRLQGAGQAAVRARAFWRLGQIVQMQAAVDPARGARFEREALGWYERALALAPNEETYLLAAGEQALTIGDKTAALRYYLRALDAVPGSADARTGIERARS